MFKAFLNTFNKIGACFKGKSATRLVGLGLCAAVCVFSVCFQSGYRTAIAVTYNGELIGYVDNVNQAMLVEQRVRDDAKTRGTAEIEFNFTESVVNKKSVSALDHMAREAISHTVITDPNIVVAGLYLDGVLTAVGDDINSVQAIINALQQKYMTDGMIFDGFTADIQISELTVKASESYTYINSLESFSEAQIDLGVKTHRTEEYDQTIGYKTVYSYDSSKDTSFKETTQKGENGLKHVVATVYYINGEKTSSETVSSETVKEAVSAKVTVGSKNTTFQEIKDNLADANAANGGSKVTYIFPLEIRSGAYISSYWGDGRNHKAMDFATPKGTDIYAAADGEVTIATKASDYGNYIEIKHADGSRTRYAHCSELLVKKGDVVKQGQHIAEVGSTGRSTGNHLHFEVWINGTRVNPAPYLGIK